MGRLKVGFVLDDTLDTPDGVQQYILTLGNWLTAQGHDVHYLVGATARSDIPNIHPLSRNVRVKFNGNRMSTPLPASRRRIRELLALHKFDVLHIQIPYSPFMARRVIRSAPPQTAIVGTFHIAPQSSTVRVANKLLGIMLKSSLKRFDSIFSVSQAARSFAKQAYGIDSDILPNVVHARHFVEAQPFPASSGLPTVVFVGRLVPRKGCQVLLEAVSLLRNDPAAPRFRTVVCGRGPLEQQLKSYVAQQNLTDEVTFTGFVSEDDKARFLKSADVAVFPSTGGESFGIVLLEAMSAERPVVIGADNEGYHTVLAPNPDLLVPVGDAAALAETIKRFLQDDKAHSKALAWQKSYVRQFDAAVVGPRLVARYMQALRSRPKVR
jgi:phosphatidyl-myo-inositol alpha-mannosyltransferase